MGRGRRDLAWRRRGDDGLVSLVGRIPVTPVPITEAHRSVRGLSPVLLLTALSFGMLTTAAHAQSASGKVRTTACPELGAGFVRLPDSNTCIRTGAAAVMDTYSGRGISNTTSFGNTVTDTGSQTSSSTNATDPWKQTR